MLLRRGRLARDGIVATGAMSSMHDLNPGVEAAKRKAVVATTGGGGARESIESLLALVARPLLLAKLFYSPPPNQFSLKSYSSAFRDSEVTSLNAVARQEGTVHSGQESNSLIGRIPSGSIVSFEPCE